MGTIEHDGTRDTTTVRLEAPPLIDRPQLVDELNAAGFTPTSGQREGSTLVVTFDGRVDVEAVIDIVEAHQPSNIDQIDQLLTKAQRVWAGDDMFTQAQAQKILAGLVLVVAKYLR